MIVEISKALFKSSEESINIFVHAAIGLMLEWLGEYGYLGWHSALTLDEDQPLLMEKH